MRLRHLVAVAAVAASASPALAQSNDPIELFAQVSAGLYDGGKVSIGTLGVGTVEKKTAKSFVVSLADGAASFTFDEPQPCVFTEVSEMKGQPTVVIRFNLDAVTAIKFESQGPYNGLNAVALNFEGNGDLVQLLDDKGSAVAVPPSASIVTSVSPDDLNAAAEALRAFCPGP
jgi:hypothetical protein